MYARKQQNLLQLEQIYFYLRYFGANLDKFRRV